MNKHNLNFNQIKFVCGGAYCGCSTIFFNHTIDESKIFKVDTIHSCIFECCQRAYQYYHFSEYLYDKKFTGDCAAPRKNINEAITMAEKVIRDSDFDLNRLNTPKSSKK